MDISFYYVNTLNGSNGFFGFMIFRSIESVSFHGDCVVYLKRTMAYTSLQIWMKFRPVYNP